MKAARTKSLDQGREAGLRTRLLSAVLCMVAVGSLAGRALAATVKLDIVPFGVELVSGKDPRWDTVEIKSYVYNHGDTTYVNTGNKPLLYLDVRVDDASVRKHNLAVGDSIPALGGFFLKDTLTVIKAPFVVTAWADPLRSFHAEAAVEETRASSLYYDLHPKVDTVVKAGCPPGTTPSSVPRAFARVSAKGLPAVIYDVVGRPVWSGRLGAGEIPARGLPEGVYLLVRGGAGRTFRIVPE